MKILYIHTYYQLKGGEDAVFEQEYLLLKEKHEVKKLIFNNATGYIGGLQFIISIWNKGAAKKVKAAIRGFKPDIIFINNWHFAVGPLVFRVVKSMKVPIIVTLHNYRLLCPSATLFCKGSLFEDSLNVNFPWSAIRNKVYRNSSILTFWLAFINWFHKKIGTWEMVDKYITLTEFTKEIFVKNEPSIFQKKITVKPNFVVQPPLSKSSRGKHFLFAGRLSEEKGIKLLLKAFQNSPYQLKIAGDGPLKSEVMAACNNSIIFLGALTTDELKVAMQECTALIFPSIWYEPFGLVIIEALASGCPVIASNIGSPGQIIKDKVNGLIFKHDSVNDLISSISYWANLPIFEKQLYEERALDSYQSNFTPENNMEILNSIFDAVVEKPSKMVG